jgi:hypothetical protein
VTDPTRQSADADLFTPSASRLATLFFSDLAELGRFEPVPVDNLPAERLRSRATITAPFP